MHLVTGEAVPLPMTDKGGPWRAWAGAPFLSMSSFQVRAPPGSSLREGREAKRRGHPRHVGAGLVRRVRGRMHMLLKQ